jgi:hypothetical protein
MLPRDGSPSVVFIHHRPHGELLSTASIIRPDDRIGADEVNDFRRQLRYSDGALLSNVRSFRSGIDCVRSDGVNDAVRGAASDGDREADYDSNDDDDVDIDDKNTTSLHHDGIRCNSPVSSGVLAPGTCGALAASCIGNQFHRRRRRTAFTSEQVNPVTYHL